jgi:hypothetical protein
MAATMPLSCLLEHLMAPEAAMRQLLPAIRDSGVLVGGSPTMPDFIACIHQRQLRRKYAGKVMDDLRAHKHLSVIKSDPGEILPQRFSRIGDWVFNGAL